MRALAQRLGLAQRVWFVGALSDMDQAYRAADCLVHPTLEDTYAMVVLEAMAHGLPVVVSAARWCGIAAELHDGVQALLLHKPDDALALHSTLWRLLTSPELVSTLSQQGQFFASNKTWVDVASAYESIYCHLKNDLLTE
jgi:UDP-glucose:(heptosyl)LPS alpha-1,3-glucosyltransferase